MIALCTLNIHNGIWFKYNICLAHKSYLDFGNPMSLYVGRGQQPNLYYHTAAGQGRMFFLTYLGLAMALQKVWEACDPI